MQEEAIELLVNGVVNVMRHLAMIENDRDVAAAFCAIATNADVAALEFAEKLCAFREVHVLPFPP
jgi:hypothetical protein